MFLLRSNDGHLGSGHYYIRISDVFNSAVR